MAASTTVCSLNGAKCSTILLASIFEKSRMSVISVSSVSPEQRIVLTRSHCASVGVWELRDQVFVMSASGVSPEHRIVPTESHQARG